MGGYCGQTPLFPFPQPLSQGGDRPRKGQPCPRVTQHKEGALPCALLIMGQIWCHVPLLGGSLAFLSTDVEWDLALPSLNSHERKPVPSAWVDNSGEKLQLVLPQLEHLSLAPCPFPRGQSRLQAQRQ